MFGGNKVDYVQLSSLCSTFIDGDWIESKDQSESGIRLIQTGNVGCGEYKDKGDKAKYITEDTFNKLHCTEIYPGDILISRLPDPVGRACVLPEGLGKCVTAVDCTIIRFSEKILPNFFVAYTNTPEYLTQIKSTLAGTTRLRVSRGNLGKVKIPVPSIEQQRTFVSIAEQADKSKFMRSKSQFIEMFGQSSLDNGIIGDYLLLKAGKAMPADRILSSKADGMFPCFGGNGIRGYVDSYNYDGDYAIIGRQGALCGNVCLAQGKFYATEHAVVVTPKAIVDSTWLFFALNQMNLNQYARGVAQPGLAVNELEKLPFSVPDINKQIEFSIIAKQADKSKLIGLLWKHCHCRDVYTK